MFVKGVEYWKRPSQHSDWGGLLSYR